MDERRIEGTSMDETKIELASLVAEAKSLKSDDGENPEYDRALVELVCYMSGNSSECLRTIAKDLEISGDLWVLDVVLDADGSWTCPYCKESNNTERPEAVVQCTWCDKLSRRDEKTEMLNALKTVQLALANDRDGEPIVIGERSYALEEVKYCFIDSVLERYEKE